MFSDKKSKDSHGQTDARTRVKFLVGNGNQYVRPQYPRSGGLCAGTRQCSDQIGFNFFETLEETRFRQCSDFLFHMSILCVLIPSIAVQHSAHLRSIPPYRTAQFLAGAKAFMEFSESITIQLWLVVVHY